MQEQELTQETLEMCKGCYFRSIHGWCSLMSTSEQNERSENGFCEKVARQVLEEGSKERDRLGRWIFHKR